MQLRVAKDYCVQMALTTRAPRSWDLPEQTLLVNHVINSTVSSETGFTLYELTFGSPTSLYLDLPAAAVDADHVLIQRLNGHLRELDRLRPSHGSRTRQQRLAAQPHALTYAPGNYILLAREPGRMKETTLSAPFSGP